MKSKILAFIIVIAMALTMLPMVSVFAAGEDINLAVPQNVTAELKQHEDGRPYFYVKWNNPQSLINIAREEDEIGEANLAYQIDCKVGNGKWNYENEGDTITGNGLFFVDDTYQSCHAEYSPINEGILDTIDIKANVYQFRVRYSFYSSDDDGDHYAFSSFSTPFSIGMKAFYKDASSWAVAELDKAVEYGFITDKIKNNMKGPITREEFCEVVVRLYEKLTGNTASYGSNPFSDTSNQEILKAYELGIVKGVGEGKFAPNNLVTRQEISVMLNRAVKVCKPNADFSTNGVSRFKDEDQIASWAIDAVRFMSKNGIIKGAGDGSIDPKGNTTREQAVLLVVRTYEKFDVK